MTQLIGKGLLAGAIVVAASEIAKRSALFGALVVSLPLTSILAMVALFQDTRDADLVADFAESIIWLVIPSLVLFVVLPIMIRRGWSFEVSPRRRNSDHGRLCVGSLVGSIDKRVRLNKFWYFMST